MLGQQSQDHTGFGAPGTGRTPLYHSFVTLVFCLLICNWRERERERESGVTQIYGNSPEMLITQAPPLPVLPVGVDAGYLGGGDARGLAGLVDKVTDLGGLEVVCDRWRMSQGIWLFVQVRAVRAGNKRSHHSSFYRVRAIHVGLGLGLGLGIGLAL